MWGRCPHFPEAPKLQRSRERGNFCGFSTLEVTLPCGGGRQPPARAGRNRNRAEGDIHYPPMPAQESACILSDDYWAIIERRAKKTVSAQFVEGACEGEKTVPTSSALL